MAATQTWNPAIMQPFDYVPLTRVVFGEGSIEKLGELIREIGATKVLLVSDPGVVAAGHAERALQSLRSARLDPVIFSEVEENPTARNVSAGKQIASEHRIDFIVGLGGGSAIDCAKGINFVCTNGGRIRDYWGTGKARKPMLPMAAIPTTAGTGSEVTSFAVISDAETGLKMTCRARGAAPRVAILDPTSTTTLPEDETAITAMDAIAHALESYVTTRRNTFSQIFARRAWELLSAGLPTVLEEPQDLEARGRMLIGANLAGSAIENSMKGAAHACANPLTANYGITHGTAINVMLPHVLRFNGSVVGHRYRTLLRQPSLSPEESAELIAWKVEELRTACSLPSSLQEIGVRRDHLPELAREATGQETGTYNPRPLTEEDFVSLYEQAYGGES